MIKTLSCEFSEAFWNIVESCGTNESKANSTLSALSKDELKQFDKEFDLAVRTISHRLKVAGKIALPLSEDGLYDTFALVVSQGRTYFDAIDKNPDTLPQVYDPPDSPLMWLPTRIYWDRFGEEIS